MPDKAKLITFLTTILMLLESLDDTKDRNPYYKNIQKLLIAKLLIKRSVIPIPRLPNYVENVIPAYDDETFRLHFRMRRSTFNFILRLIRSSLLKTKSGQKMISPEKQFLIAIWKMATPDSYRSICEKFRVAKATALYTVRRVVKALVKLAPLFITWPEGNKCEEIFMGFAMISAFPKVIGAIDGTHINIRAPHINAECYVNRKGQHSIQLQAICDHTRKFVHCFTGHVGSLHDQRVFRLSEIFEYLEDPNKFPNNSHLVGDAAYTLHEHLMTPFRDNGHLTDRQKNYNFCHVSARMAIERAFGLLKGRFRSLRTVLDMERIDIIPDFIIACCVLHNICLLQHDELSLSEINPTENPLEFNLGGRRNGAAGLAKRDMICNNLIMRNA